MDGNAKQEVAEKLRSSSSVLVTVSKDPSVDQLASALGLSLMLTALGKHTTTVFSGEIPNTMEFLDPDKTFDKTVDGLRDFIISLDKEKADKLRYKVEDNVVKIYITPYKSKLTQDDLNFSQGDFNVDLVVGLGVHERNDLDEAITSHGRILHDAAIITINDGRGKGKGGLGSVDWTNENASCLSEMLVSISEALEGGILDKQMSTAFLTGIVAATERFKNDKTTPKLMTMAAQLMAAGANQQQIAQNLQLPDVEEPKSEDKPPELPKDEGSGDDFAKEDHSMEIDRDEKEEKKEEPKAEEPQEEPPKEDDGNSEPEAKPADPDGDDLLADIEEAVHAKHNTLDDQGRTQKIDEEDPAIQQLEDELAHDSSTNLLDLEGKLKSFDPNSVEQPANDPMPEQKRERMDEGPVGEARSSDSSAIDPDDKPTMGGTFNATSEQAHDQREADRRKQLNKEILSHGSGSAEPGGVSTRGKDLQPGGDSSRGDMPSSEELMKDLQDARRAVEEAMNESVATDPGPQPIQALNANPMDMSDSGGGEMNLSNNNMAQMNQPQSPAPMSPPSMPQPQQQFQPQGGMNNPMPQMNQGPAPMPAPQMPQQQFQPQQPQGNGNPMFNMPQQQPQQNFPQQGQSPFQDPGLGPVPQQNGATPPPPMPPNAPPPMPPFN